MIDASHETFDKNIEITNRVVQRAHDKGISVDTLFARVSRNSGTSRRSSR